VTADAPTRVPEQLAERFAKAFAAFVDAVRTAVAAGVLNPAVSSTPAFLMWQTEALPRLEQDNALVQNSMALYIVGEMETIAKVARSQLSLARRLDGFPLDFAGAEHAPVLDRLETAVVVAASQLCTAAGNP
jgi:uncharacterized protein CbrC (UPF0167 family)